MRAHVERVDAVRAEERDALIGQHFVPHLLELDGGLEVVIPEQVHHLARRGECSGTPPPGWSPESARRSPGTPPAPAGRPS